MVRARSVEESFLLMEEELLEEIGASVGKAIEQDEVERILKKARNEKELSDLCAAIVAYYAIEQQDGARFFVQETAIQSGEQMRERIKKILPDEKAQLDRLPVQEEARIEEEAQKAVRIVEEIQRSVLNGANEIYDDILMQAAKEVQIGRKTYRKAAQDAAKKWAEKGIPVLRTKSGARLTIESYIPMVLRAEQKRAATMAQEVELDAYGIDLVELSSHAGSRLSHIPFQGRIYSRSGTSDKYPPLAKTGYGEVDGMVTGINCRHQMYPYIEGVSKKRFEPYDAEESKKEYLESQEQRRLERAVRRAKLEKRMLENTGADDLDVKRADSKIRKRQAALREFVDQTGRTRRYERERLFADKGEKQ
uniref:phage minor capsid protein n=1 Tax=Ndongobacter massiliensis TaxID=1871025 RepID=UPI000930C458|nr:phage minor capsid protein [Ndongobacter massiliensis]